IGELDYSTGVRLVVFSHKGDLIVAGGESGYLQIFEFATGACIATLTHHTTCPTSIAFSLDDMLLISTSRDNTLWLWDVQTGALAKILREHESFVAISPSGTLVASEVDGNHSIRIWDI